MQAYSNTHRARDVADILLTLWETTPPEPISSASGGRQIADCLTKRGLLDSGGDLGQWRPIPAGLFRPIESITHLIAAIEYLTDITVSAATAEMVAAHLKVKADVAANLARLRLSAHGVELAGDEYEE